MDVRKTINDLRIDACEASAQAQLYARHPSAGYYARQSAHFARAALRARTVAQAKRYAAQAAKMASKAKTIAGPAPRKPYKQVLREAAELFK